MAVGLAEKRTSVVVMRLTISFTNCFFRNWPNVTYNPVPSKLFNGEFQNIYLCFLS